MKNIKSALALYVQWKMFFLHFENLYLDLCLNATDVEFWYTA